MKLSWLKKQSLRTSDSQRTKAAELTLRQSLYPIILVTSLFFLWGFSYGLLDTLNKHFQVTLGVTRARSSGLQAAYFGAYPFASLGHANWIMRKYAFNAVGTVVSPVLGSYVIFLRTGEDERALRNVQWIYLAIACFCFLLAAVFYFSPIPEITGADMAFQAEETYSPSASKPLSKQYKLFHAAFAQFCYTGAQVAIAGYFINYVVETRANTDPSLGAKFLAGAQGAFSVGRFAGSLIMKFVKPRTVFLVFMSGCIVFIAPAIVHFGNAGLGLMFCVFFFESIIFPTIVALGMRGLGRHTKFGSGFIIAGVSGGAVVPPLLGVAADRYNNTGRAMIVPLMFFVAAWSYAICVNFVPAYRNVADSFHETKIGIDQTVKKDEEAASDAEVPEIKEGEARREKV
ncbi:hypothetical protein KVT40_004296 [Elsinoe batatas]|uniref:Uncharacterized protein n=1 Tax=Elsinoe batatas TaxID=2601811 RepID=A0A8K0PIF1_9PEZI|nr:hypothetical protein KVT40_004296 [Elsinoe batatas]